MTYTMDPAAQPDLAATSLSTRPPAQVTVEVGPMAHGGHCVARHEGQLVFVRHAIPGEVVVAQLTEPGPAGRFWWADTVKVLEASEFRRVHQWKLADSLRAYPAGRRPINAAPLGHIVLEYQRRLKALAFRDTMIQLGQQTAEDVEISVQGIECDEPAGLQWRTRNTFAVTDGRLSMQVNRSVDTVAVRNIPLAVPQLDKLQLWGLDFSGATRVEVVTPAHSHEALIVITPDPQVATSPELLEPYVESWRREVAKLPAHVSAMVTVSPKLAQQPEIELLRGRPWVQEEVNSQQWGNRTFRVSGAAFWQTHRDGPVTLLDSVMQAADVQPDQVVIDLHAGPGLFSRYLGETVGTSGAVLSVDADPIASHDAQHNLQDLPQVTVMNGKVKRVMASWLLNPEAKFTDGGLEDRPVDTVILNPPRAGAGRATISRLHQVDPDKIVYVSTNPTSFARDTSRLSKHGWVMASVTAYDLAPETHHMTSISVFTRRK